MISAADKKTLAAAIADSSADVYLINADTKPAAQKKLLDAHHRCHAENTSAE